MIDEGLDVLVVLLELFWVVEPVKIAESEALGEVSLSTVEVT